MKLFFLEQGKGFPVILLHGFPFDHHLWDPLINFLSADIRFVIPDLRGFGASAVVDSHYSLSEMAADVIDLMDALHLDGAVLAGHSLGGYVALEIAGQVPERVKGLALIASHIFPDSPEKIQERRETSAKLDNAPPIVVLSGMPDKLSQDEGVRAYCRYALETADTNGILGALAAMAARPSFEDIWQVLEVPKLLLGGEQDAFITREMSDRVACIGRNVIYKVLGNSGHMLLREKPQLVAEELLQYINLVRRK